MRRSILQPAREIKTEGPRASSGARSTTPTRYSYRPACRAGSCDDAFGIAGRRSDPEPDGPGRISGWRYARPASGQSRRDACAPSVQEDARGIADAIEDDARRATRWLRPLFAARAELPFVPKLTLEQILEAAGFAGPGVRPPSDIWSDLREVVGQPAGSYLRAARMETAARLLLETEISINEIGYLVGYGSPTSFRRPERAGP